MATLDAFLNQKERDIQTKQAQIDQANVELSEADILAKYGL